MKHVSGLLAVAVAGLLALPAQAARPTYSYLDLGYLDAEYPGDETANGGRFNFNVSLERWLYFTGEYNHLDLDDSDVQVRDTSVGFGAHTLNPKIQFFAAATYERSYLFGPGATEGGHALQFGLRWPVWSGLELGGDVKWYDFGDGARADRHRVTAQWRLSPVWAALGTYQGTDYPFATSKEWTLGFRAYFMTQYDLPPRKPAEPAPAAQ